MRAGLFHRSNFGNVNHLFPFDTFNSVYDCAISNFVKVLDFSVLFICQLFCRGFSFTSLLHDLSHRSFRIILIALSFRQDLFDSIVPLLLPLLDLFFNLACPLVKNLLNLELGVALNLTLFENFYQPNFAFLLNPPITLCNLLLVFSFFLFKISLIQQQPAWRLPRRSSGARQARSARPVPVRSRKSLSSGARTRKRSCATFLFAAILVSRLLSSRSISSLSACLSL
mmetsp:Transcript_27354/g.61796  ORF Transcript_27354/g.61796 Transcript_27354/m.61796 type:complete len:227 (+) Transcript_27354:700-1380(+)